MRATTRRRFAQGLLSSLGVVGLLGPGRVMAQAIRGTFSPPTGPMIFTRELTRSLVDTKAITVKRRWEVRFAQRARGFLIEGRQIGVEVSAPPALEAFAELEEARVESGMFPISLNDDGHIGEGRTIQQQSEVDQAVALALERLKNLGSSPTQRNEASNFLRSLQQSTAQATSRMPRDLFFPAKLARSENRSVPLPDGNSGQIAINFAATLSAGAGVFESATRTVTTTVGASSRTSNERWNLTSA